MRMAIIAVTLAALVVNGEKSQPKPNGHEQKAAQTVQPTGGTTDGTIIAVNQEAPEEKSDGHSKQPPSYLSRLFSPENLPAIALVFVGIGAVIAAICTLKAIERQAKLMETQLILQYRPKIVVRSAKASEFKTGIGDSARPTIQFTVVNSGGSVAHVKGGKVRIWSIQTFPPPASPPIEFTLGEEVQLRSFSLQPGEERVVKEPMGTGIINDIDWANYHAGTPTKFRDIYLIGNIWYEDDLGIRRRTGISRTYNPVMESFSARKDDEAEFSD